MSDNHEDSGPVLYAAYVDEAERYAAALHLAGEVAAACGCGQAIDDRLRQVFTLIHEAAERDALIAPAKQRWEQAGRPTSDALRAVMNRIAELIQQLRRELQAIEEAARVRRDQLAAELDDCNRRRQMQRAYQRKS